MLEHLIFRISDYDALRKGQILMDCSSLQEACKKNHLLCAEEIIKEYDVKKTRETYNGNEGVDMQFDEALLIASECDSFEVVKVIWHICLIHYYKVIIL